jgi:hypothetical protein
MRKADEISEMGVEEIVNPRIPVYSTEIERFDNSSR